MESELRILLKHSFISRKDFRDLLAEGAPDIEALRALIFEKSIMDPPDWREAMRHLKTTGHGERTPPESFNHEMLQIQQTALKVAGSDTSILLLGESGVGKSRLAARIHRESPRRAKAFVTVSCGSIPETLLESELFGVEKGAYTGANKSREGRFARAHGGTIFLDEIGELTPPLQVKLLRVIQEKKIEPLGSAEEMDVDVRLITATNRDLEEDVRTGKFRKDLYFRLNVVPLTLLPLRERREDIAPLTAYFVERFASKNGIRVETVDPRITDIMTAYSWPGNIRELENCVERLIVLSRDGALSADDFPPRILRESGNSRGLRTGTPAGASPGSSVGHSEAGAGDQSDPDDARTFLSLRELEEQHIKEALARSRASINRAAGLLGIHRNTLSRKIEEFGIEAARFKRRPIRPN
ncbi:MAG: sigma 54-interacting transcriptional regulator [Leptospirales bacterium]|jgi:transcriptional regulator with PAS, ATPase and Fis domain